MSERSILAGQHTICDRRYSSYSIESSYASRSHIGEEAIVLVRENITWDFTERGSQCRRLERTLSDLFAPGWGINP